MVQSAIKLSCLVDIKRGGFTDLRGLSINLNISLLSPRNGEDGKTMDFGSGINWIMALGPIVLGLATLGVWFLGGMLFNSGNQKKWVKIVAVILGICTLASAAGFTYQATQPGDSAELVTYTWAQPVVTDSQAYITQTGLASATWVYTNAGNASGVFNISISRSDLNAGWAYTTAEIGAVPTYTSTTTGITTSLLNISNSQPSALWHNSDLAHSNSMVNVPTGETRADWATLTLGLNTGTMNAMASLDTLVLHVTIAGYDYAITVMKK
jgi:hypothetical protein